MYSDADTTTTNGSMQPVGDYLDWSFKGRLEASATEAQERAARERQERIERLTAMGVSCFECEDTGRITEPSAYRRGMVCICEMGRTVIQREAELEMRNALAGVAHGIGVPTRFEHITFDTFPDQSSPALAAVRQWVEDASARETQPMKPGIYLHGQFGRGKTGLIVAALRELVERAVRHGMETRSSFGMYTAYQRHARFVTSTGLLESLRPHDGSENEDLIHKYQTTEYLAIDDLGAERLTEWGVDRLFEIVNHRHSELLPMIVSSNLSPGELAKRINKQIGDQSGDRIVERLIESCTVLRFDDAAPNWRLAR